MLNIKNNIAEKMSLGSFCCGRADYFSSVHVMSNYIVHKLLKLGTVTSAFMCGIAFTDGHKFILYCQFLE